MGRVQLAIDVGDLDEAIGFYTRLFSTEPAKVKDGYANFAITDPPLKLVLFEKPGAGGTLNHLGVEVETAAEVEAATAALQAEQAKRRAWHDENVRRRHNYIPFLFHFLKTLAEKKQLKPLIQQARELQQAP